MKKSKHNYQFFADCLSIWKAPQRNATCTASVFIPIAAAPWSTVHVQVLSACSYRDCQSFTSHTRLFNEVSWQHTKPDKFDLK